MSKPFDYSKWDNIELSDDEEDVHPNIEKESWFRMKHRARVEREEKEEADKEKISKEITAAKFRIKEIECQLKDLENSEDSDDELEDKEGLEAELKELKSANAAREKKLIDYEKNKKWNVDNLCHVVEERTIVNKGADTKFSEKGFAVENEDDVQIDPGMVEAMKEVDQKELEAKARKATTKTKTASTAMTKSKPSTAAPPPNLDDAILSYPQFVEKYQDLLEKWMTIRDFEKCQQFLLLHGKVLLQENASNYLLLASLEDEMNGYRDKMRLTARQSQILSNIAELAKSLKRHPGNVILPFFSRLQQPEFLKGFLDGVEGFIQKIIQRAVVKKEEMKMQELEEQTREVDLKDVPLEERLGPGGLDPVEVFESLPESLQKAFESRDVEELKKALTNMPAEEAENHMKRCVAAGLWNEG